MALYSIRLELARTKEFPAGSAQHGYEFVAPLDAAGHLSAAEWQREKARCIVRRFQLGASEETGRLSHVGQGWHFDYEAGRRDDDEPFFKLDRHTIKQGEYVSVTEHDGVTRPFKIVRVQKAE